MALVAVLMCTTAAGVFYVLDNVVNVMSRAGVSQPQPKPVPQGASPKPPVFPPNRVIREGDLPKR